MRCCWRPNQLFVLAGIRQLSSIVPNHIPSYASGVASQPLRGWTVGDALRHATEAFPTNDALVVRHQSVRWSYQELDRRVDELASVLLLTLGMQPGDRLGIWAPNCSEWALLQFATARIGVILVTINSAYRPKELLYALNKVGCKALVMAHGVKSNDFVATLHDVIPDLNAFKPGEIASKSVPSLRHVILLPGGSTRRETRGLSAMHRFEDISVGGTPDARRQVREVATQLHFDDNVNIQYTSGTTGSPKGATLTHHNIVNNGFFVGEAIRLTDSDRVCIPVPLFHCFGMVMGNLACVTHGATMVYPSEVFDAEQTLATVQEERCTALYGVPSMFIACLSHPNLANYCLTHLRTGIMAGSPCPLEVMRKVMSQLHMPHVTIAYGMTETSPVSTQSAVDDPPEARVSTVGRVHPHVEIMITGPDGRVVPRGVTGELCTRGYSVMSGYWADDEKTNEAINKAGWMRTGDLASMDDAGYVRIVGRLKDMIIRGGENVYPREVEEHLHCHSAVDEAHVFGIPDELLGEVVCAWVRLKKRQTPAIDEDSIRQELLEHCRRGIAHYKVPKHICFVTSFPMTVSGKVQKYIMREEMSKAVSLSS